MTSTFNTSQYDFVDPVHALNTVREFGFELMPCALDSEATILISSTHKQLDVCNLESWLPVIVQAVIPYFAATHPVPHNPRQQMALFLRHLRSVQAFSVAVSARDIFLTATSIAQDKHGFSQPVSGAFWGVEAVVAWMEKIA